MIQPVRFILLFRTLADVRSVVLQIHSVTYLYVVCGTVCHGLGTLPATNSVSLEGRDGLSGAAPRAGKSDSLESWPPDGNWELGLAAARRLSWETWLRCVRATW